jgi:hypothetical protein
MSNKTLIPVIIILSLITIGVASLIQLSKVPEKVAMNTSSEVVSSVKSQVVSSSSSVQIVNSSSVASSAQKVVESVGVESLKAESQTKGNSLIPEFDWRYQTSLKLQTSNEITSISVGECYITGKFKAGQCKIIDQKLIPILTLYVFGGKPLLPEPDSQTQRLINLIDGYGACSFHELSFDFKTSTISVLKSLDCETNSETKKLINEYSEEFYKLNYPESYKN